MSLEERVVKLEEEVKRLRSALEQNLSSTEEIANACVEAGMDIKNKDSD